VRKSVLVNKYLKQITHFTKLSWLWKYVTHHCIQIQWDKPNGMKYVKTYKARQKLKCLQHCNKLRQSYKIQTVFMMIVQACSITISNGACCKQINKKIPAKYQRDPILAGKIPNTIQKWTVT
jgi:hypothetical protein